MEYAPKFAAEHVDLEALRMFSKQDFVEMGVKIGPAIKMFTRLPTWRP